MKSKCAFCCLGVLLAASQLLAAPSWLPASSSDRPRLQSIYGEEHLIEELRDQSTKALVIVFMGIDCPVVRHYVPRLNELYAKFNLQNVKFLAIYANAGEHVLAMAPHASQTDLAFPAFIDVHHRLADLLDAQVMSEVVVLDRDFEKRLSRSYR